MRARRRRATPQDRVHLLAHANPVGKDVERFGFGSLEEYLDFIRAHLPEHLDLTYSLPILKAFEEPGRGGRRDDAARIRDLQGAIDDPATRAIVALSGGGYFSRILPHIRFSPLARRKRRLLVTGFSEMTNLLNLMAGYPSCHAWYWLCPNYLAWKIKPVAAAREAFGEFWRLLGGWLADQSPAPRSVPEKLAFPESIAVKIAAGAPAAGNIRIFGGCLSVLAVLAAARKRPRVVRADSWLLIEDVNEAPHRIDRQIAALSFAGWLGRLGGVIVGDFHMDKGDQKGLTVEILKYHLPRGTPIVLAAQVGHVWPMAATPLNRWLELRIAGGKSVIRAES